MKHFFGRNKSSSGHLSKSRVSLNGSFAEASENLLKNINTESRDKLNKKRLAPAPPPSLQQIHTSHSESKAINELINSSSKKKKAPAPPPPTSLTCCNPQPEDMLNVQTNLEDDSSKINNSENISISESHHSHSSSSPISSLSSRSSSNNSTNILVTNSLIIPAAEALNIEAISDRVHASSPLPQAQADIKLNESLVKKRDSIQSCSSDIDEMENSMQSISSTKTGKFCLIILFKLFIWSRRMYLNLNQVNLYKTSLQTTNGFIA